MKFTYCNLCCKSVNKEESVFENDSQKIICEEDVTSTIPMDKFDFTFTIDEKDGYYEVISFECDKFNMTEIVLKRVEVGRENEKIRILSHIDSYKKEDMKYFKIGTLYKVNINLSH